MMETQSRASSLGSVVSLVIVACAVGSLIPMFMIGRHQRSVMLMAMFLVWVLSPYVGLWWLNVRARAWSASGRRTLEYATIMISLFALGRYVWVVVSPLKAQPASTFMIVPFVSWIAIAIAVAVGMRSSRSM